MWVYQQTLLSLSIFTASPHLLLFLLVMSPSRHLKKTSCRRTLRELSSSSESSCRSVTELQRMPAGSWSRPATSRWAGRGAAVHWLLLPSPLSSLCLLFAVLAHTHSFLDQAIGFRLSNAIRNFCFDGSWELYTLAPAGSGGLVGRLQYFRIVSQLKLFNKHQTSRAVNSNHMRMWYF